MTQANTRLNFNCMWNFLTFPKIQFFIWLIVLSRNPTREFRIMRGMDPPTFCVSFQFELDTITNILCECLMALKLWQDLQPLFCFVFVFVFLLK